MIVSSDTWWPMRCSCYESRQCRNSLVNGQLIWMSRYVYSTVYIGGKTQTFLSTTFHIPWGIKVGSRGFPVTSRGDPVCVCCLAGCHRGRAEQSNRTCVLLLKAPKEDEEDPYINVSVLASLLNHNLCRWWCLELCKYASTWNLSFWFCSTDTWGGRFWCNSCSSVVIQVCQSKRARCSIATLWKALWRRFYKSSCSSSNIQGHFMHARSVSIKQPFLHLMIRCV